MLSKSGSGVGWVEPRITCLDAQGWVSFTKQIRITGRNPTNSSSILLSLPHSTQPTLIIELRFIDSKGHALEIRFSATIGIVNRRIQAGYDLVSDFLLLGLAQ